jgi:hypothetical protein
MTNFAKQLTIIPNPEETIAVIKTSSVTESVMW